MMQHRIKITGFLSLLFIMAAFLLPAWAPAAEPQWFAGLGFEFASGKYGTDVTTDSVYVPFTATVYPTVRLDVSLVIPYIYQSSSAANIGIFRGPQGQTMGMQNLGTGTAGTGSGTMTTTAGGAHNAQSGLGDVIARAGYVLIPESKLMPQIRPNIFVKFPTADKALGTDEIDEGFALELSKRLGDWYSFAEVGYTIQGKSPALALKNYLSYRAGAGYQVTDKFRPMLMLKGFTSPAEGTTDLLEARLRLIYQASKRTGIEGFLARGLTTSSPDYSTGLAIFYNF